MSRKPIYLAAISALALVAALNFRLAIATRELESEAAVVTGPLDQHERHPSLIASDTASYGTALDEHERRASAPLSTMALDQHERHPAGIRLSADAPLDQHERHPDGMPFNP